jgi:hypothetical protein
METVIKAIVLALLLLATGCAVLHCPCESKREHEQIKPA